MKILVACESSGVVREAFNARTGCHAISCDLLPPDDGRVDFHYQGSVFDILDDGWDMLLAYPPCTYLCASGMHWTRRGLRDPQLTVDAIEFVERLWAAPIPRICIENSLGVLSTQSKLGKPTQIIQPYQFGDDASKATCLWLRNLPPLMPTRSVPPRIVNGRPRWSNQTDSGQNKLPPSNDRWKLRSKTFQGIAEAKADQWSDLPAITCSAFTLI